MRSFVPIIVTVFAAFVMPGCGSGELTTPTSSAPGSQANSESNSSKSDVGAATELEGPTIFGVDVELQKELRGLLALFIEQRRFPGDPAENLAKAFDSAMETIRRPANEFGIDPDAEGNLAWPKEFEERIESFRAEFEAMTFFDSYEIDLPEWAQPLLDEYNANRISPIRKELLFRLASGDVMLDMT